MAKYLFPAVTTLVILLAACSPEPQTHTTRSSAFGDALVLQIKGASRKKAQQAANSAIEDLHFVAEVSHPWNPGPLGRTNQLLGYEATFSANPSVLPMIRRAAALEKLSGGYYAPALGKLQSLWGFHREVPGGPVPEQKALNAVLAARPSMANIHIEGIRMSSDNAEVRIDFGPFARGYAIDTARQRLQEHGITSAKIDNGDSLAVLGEGWQYTLADDRSIQLEPGEAVVRLSTETDAYEEGGNLYHPFIDPTNGLPSSGLSSVIIIDGSAADAAAKAQAILAGGEARMGELLELMQVDLAEITTTDGRLITTEKLSNRVTTVRKP